MTVFPPGRGLSRPPKKKRREREMTGTMHCVWREIETRGDGFLTDDNNVDVVVSVSVRDSYV